MILVTVTIGSVNSAPATVLNTLRPVATMTVNYIYFNRSFAVHLTINVTLVLATILLVVNNGRISPRRIAITFAHLNHVVIGA